MAIVYYTQQDEFDLVNSGQDCIGWTVTDQAGNRIGEVTEMLIDDERMIVDSILIDRRRRIPAQDFALRDGRVVVRGVTEADGAARQTTTTTTTTTETETHTAPMTREANARNVAGVTREAQENEITLPVIEEQLAVGKRTVERGAARIRTRVEEVPVEESVTLREENVTVERRPVNRPVENAPAAFKEGTIEVTEMAEVPIVGKQARVVEEVVVGKEVTEREETVRETVKRTDVEIDEVDATDNRRQTNR